VATSRNRGKQNVTISLDRQVLRKAKVLAARRDTSTSRPLAREIEFMVGEDEACERAEGQAAASRQRISRWLVSRASREELHMRYIVRLSTRMS